MADSSKSKKPDSKTSGVGFQKLDNEADSKTSESSNSEKSAEPTAANKKPEPEVPTESISISPVTSSEPAKAETKPEVAPTPKPPEPKSEPVSATQPNVEPKPEPVNVVKPPAETKAEPISASMHPPEVKPEQMSAPMNPPEVKPEPINVVKPPAETKAEPLTTAPTVPVISEAPETVETSQLDVQVIKEKVLHFISDLPEIFSNFFGEYQRPLWTVVGFVLIIVTIKALVGVLDSINDIPLVESTLEIVGMGYSGWFVYRYLLRSENRQELLAKFQSWKAEFLGREDS